MTVHQWTPAEREHRARAAERRRRRDLTVAAGALRRTRGSAAAATSNLRSEAEKYRAESLRLSSSGLDGSLDAWRAAERRDRAAELIATGAAR